MENLNKEAIKNNEKDGFLYEEYVNSLMLVYTENLYFPKYFYFVSDFP
jgi:hypothetical protein